MVEVFTGSVDVLVPVKVEDGLADGPRAIALEVRYQACSDKICLPPAEREADTGIVIRAGAPVYKFNVPPGYRKVGQPTPSVASLGMEPSLDLHFILLALGFGLAALLTPCVFPLIPLTMSYFLKRTGTSRAESVRQALLFGAGIVLLFAMLGLAVTAVAGPFGVVQLAARGGINFQKAECRESGKGGVIEKTLHFPETLPSASWIVVLASARRQSGARQTSE
jgi:thiol:disulfide interchange protein DsbD